MSAGARLVDRPDVPERRLWLGLTVAPCAWIAEGLFGWFFGARICEALPIATVRLVIGAFSLAMLAVAAAGLFVGVGSLRAARDRSPGGSDRVEFMARAGVFVSTSFVIGIVWSGLSSAVLNTCGWMR
jgi:hypothetical protein